MDKKQIHLGVIGCGSRGRGLLEWAICKRDNVKVVIVCDIAEDHACQARDIVKKCDGNEPDVCTDYHEVLNRADVDAVLIATDWLFHIPISIEAMKAGKIVGCEVAGAYSIQECWDLVRTQEETGVPCMLLENCCYGRDELMVLNMVKQGLFGDVVHCRGAYQHDLRFMYAAQSGELFRGKDYVYRNCDTYPTHDLGPIAKILNINRGNRMESLVSIASCSKGMDEYMNQHAADDPSLKPRTFRHGDMITTVIKCAGGESIILNLSTTLPHYYSRDFQVHGTRAMYCEDSHSLYMDSRHHDNEMDWKPMWNNAEKMWEEFDHPIWKDNLENGPRGGHGGMDGLVFDAFFTAIEEHLPMPIDVYDMAAWMCITALSEKSITCGSAPVEIPDFTKGRWMYREEEPDWLYCLSKVCK